MGYNMVCSQAITTADGNTQGGVGVVVQDQLQGWSIESMRFQGTNVVSCGVVLGKQTPLIGEYLPPFTLEHRWKLPGNYRDLFKVMVFYPFGWRTKRILVSAITGF